MKHARDMRNALKILLGKREDTTLCGKLKRKFVYNIEKNIKINRV